MSTFHTVVTLPCDRLDALTLSPTETALVAVNAQSISEAHAALETLTASAHLLEDHGYWLAAQSESPAGLAGGQFRSNLGALAQVTGLRSLFSLSVSNPANEALLARLRTAPYAAVFARQAKPTRLWLPLPPFYYIALDVYNASGEWCAHQRLQDLDLSDKLRLSSSVVQTALERGYYLNWDCASWKCNPIFVNAFKVAGWLVDGHSAFYENSYWLHQDTLEWWHKFEGRSQLLSKERA